MIIKIIQHTLLSIVLISFIFRIITFVELIRKPTLIIIIHLILFLIVLAYYNFQLHKFLLNWISEKKQYKEKIRSQTIIMESFLNDNLKDRELELLKNDIKFMQRKELSEEIYQKYDKQLKEKLKEAKKILKEKEYEERISQLQNKESILKNKLHNIEYEIREKTQTEEERLEQIKENMNIDEETVFFKDDLLEEEIAILKSEGYKQTNEYSILNKKIETVLVKPISNHSATHIFISWEIKKLLDILKMKNIKEHSTVDADITFKHKNKFYAIEVETGNLLKKKAQAVDKVEYLKKKYNDRWLFVVSNKNLLKEYKKLGFATQRSRVEKTIKKWLKIDT